MLKKITEPLAIYQKKPTDGNHHASPTPSASEQAGSSKRQRVNWKIMGSLAALVVVVGVAAAGILTAQRQTQVAGPLAPNAPESQPQAAGNPTGTFAATCIPGSNAPSYKFTISNINLGGSQFAYSQIFISIDHGVGHENDYIRVREFLGTPSYPNDPNWSGYIIHDFKTFSNTLEVTWNDSQKIGGNQKTLSELSNFMRSNNIAGPLTIGANLGVTTNGQISQNNWIGGSKLNIPDPTCGGSGGGGGTSNPPPVPVPTSSQCTMSFVVTEDTPVTYKCDSSCTTTAQCRTSSDANAANYVCSAAQGNKCRLESNQTSITCQPATPVTYKCDSSCTTTAQCRTSSDANAANYVCSAAQGNKCRLESNQTSVTCQPPVPTGNARCDDKMAVQFKPNTDGIEYVEKAVIQKGAKFQYRVTVTSDRLTPGAVVLTDTLPTNISFVAGSAKVYAGTATTSPSTPITPTVAGQKLTFNLGTFTSKKTVVVQYQVQASADIAPAVNYTNKAVVTTAGKAASPCESTVRVPATAQAICEEKVALVDYSGKQINQSDPVTVNTTFAYQVTVKAEEATAGEVTMTDVLSNNLQFIEAQTTGLTFNEATKTLTASLGTLGKSGSETKVLAFKAKVKSTALPGKIVNTAVIKTGTGEEYTCPVTITVADFECNSSCFTDAQCQSANADYVCSADHDNRCRLDSNRASSTCTPKTYACNSSCSTNADCQSVNDDYICAEVDEGKRCRLDDYEEEENCQRPEPTPTPTPAPGCNDTCTTNADCSNPDHICYTTEDGNKCRLAEYVNSETCTKPATKVTTTPVTTSQPELPQELPQTGPEDWVNWLKAGLITLGVGALLLLLL